MGCTFCGRAILFGGVSEGDHHFCNRGMDARVAGGWGESHGGLASE